MMIGPLNTAAQYWWAWMGSMLWQVSLLILIVSALDHVLRRWAWPQVRYALWLLVLVKLVLPPSWTLPSSLISNGPSLIATRFEERLATRVQAAGSGEILRKPPAIPAYAPTPGALDQPSDSPGGIQAIMKGPAAVSGPPSPHLGWKAIAFLVWIAGMGLFLALLAWRIAGLRRWHSRQVEKKRIPVWYYELLVETTKRLKLGRLPAIVFSKDAKAPAVYGLFRPVLLLPASYLDSLPREDAEHVLLHELAHLKRGDLWLHGLCLLLQIVYWFNPLLIWVRRQMKHVREICCDLTIANVLKEKTMRYRETLLNTARQLLTETAEPGMGLLGVFEDPFRLVARLRWLEKRTWRSRKLMTLTVVLVTMVMTAVVLPMGGRDREPTRSETGPQARIGAEAARIEGLRLDVEIKSTPPLYAAVLPRIGGLDEFERSLGQVNRLLAEASIAPSGPPFGRYISDENDVSPDDFVWEIGYPVPAGTRVDPPLEIIRISGQQVASTTVEGIRLTDAVWPKFVKAIQDIGYVPAGLPVLEIWKGEPEGKEFWWKTELQITAFAPEEGYPGMEISFKETEPASALVLPMRGAYANTAEGMEKLKRYVSDSGIRTTGPPFGIYFTDPSKVPPSQYRWEIGYPVEAEIAVEPPFRIRRFEGARVASTILPGPPEPDYPWAAFILQLVLEGSIPSLPAIEIWHGEPGTSGPQGPRVELQIPVWDLEELADIGKAESEKGIEAPAGAVVSRYPFVRKKAAPFQAVSLIVRGTFEGLFTGMRELQSWMRRSGTEPVGPAFIQQFSNVRVRSPEHPTEWRIGYPVPEGTTAPAPFELVEFPAMEVTSVELTGGFDEDDLNQQWARWLLERRYRIAGGALIFCPDKLHHPDRRDPRWEIRAEILKVEDTLPEIEISTQWSRPLIAAVLPMEGSHAAEPEALARLEAYLRSAGISPSGKPFFRYFNDAEIMPEDELLWEVGFPVPSGTAVQSPFEIKELPEGLEAFTEFECTKEDLLKYCYAYAAQLQVNGFFAIGYPMITLKSGDIRGRAIREVRIPVRKKRPNPNSLPAFY